MSEKRNTPTSLAETMIRRSINNSAMGKALGLTKQELFKVKAPNTEGLTYEAPDVQIPSESDVLAAFEDLRRETAPKQVLEIGEEIDFGDDVVIDVVPYCKGKILPLLARRRFQSVLGAGDLFEDLDANLIGLPVGFQGHVQCVLPLDYPHPEFAGRTAVFLVRIHEALRNDLEEELEDVLPRLGLGETLDEVVDNLTQELIEQNDAAEEIAAARNYMVQLGSRVEQLVPDSIIDQELTTQWMNGESKTLLELSVPAEDRDEALKTYLSTPALREWVREQVLTSAAVIAIAERDQFKMSKEEFREQWQQVRAETGTQMSYEQFIKDAKAGDKDSVDLMHHLIYLKMTQHVLAATQK